MSDLNAATTPSSSSSVWGGTRATRAEEADLSMLSDTPSAVARGDVALPRVFDLLSPVKPRVASASRVEEETVEDVVGVEGVEVVR